MVQSSCTSIFLAYLAVVSDHFLPPCHSQTVPLATYESGRVPPKKEYVLYAPLSVRQREAYDRVLDGGLRKIAATEVTQGMGPLSRKNKGWKSESKAVKHRTYLYGTFQVPIPETINANSSVQSEGRGFS